MTSRERVRAALNHQEADKIPIDCGGMRSTGLLGVTYNKLKEHLKQKSGETKIYDMVQQLALVEDWYLDRFQIDVIDLARGFAGNPEEWNDWKLPDGSPAKVPAWLKIEQDGDSWFCVDDVGDRLAEMPEGSFYFDQKIWPLYGQDPDNFDDLYKLPVEVLAKIRAVLAKDIYVRVDGPAQVASFVYDNDTFIIESFLPETTAVRIVVDENAGAPCDALSGETLAGQPLLDWRGQPTGEIGFEAVVSPHSFRVFRLKK